MTSLELMLTFVVTRIARQIVGVKNVKNERVLNDLSIFMVPATKQYCGSD